jgi:uncharacterized HAD superfamily protein
MKLYLVEYCQAYFEKNVREARAVETSITAVFIISLTMTRYKTFQLLTRSLWYKALKEVQHVSIHICIPCICVSVYVYLYTYIVRATMSVEK